MIRKYAYFVIGDRRNGHAWFHHEVRGWVLQDEADGYSTVEAAQEVIDRLHLGDVAKTFKLTITLEDA